MEVLLKQRNPSKDIAPRASFDDTGTSNYTQKSELRIKWNCVCKIELLAEM